MNYYWQQLQELYRAYEANWQILGLVAILLFIGTLITVPLVIIILPTRYLTEDRSHRRHSRRVWYIPYLLSKNAVGGIFILSGLVMLVLPGQGLLTLAVGICLIDFPGKRLLVQRILCRKGVLTVINRLRAKAARPPLEMPEK
jgi:amino acid transporter